MGSTPPTVLLFGDLTDSWVDGMDYVFDQATTTPWLQSFLNDLFSAFKAEVRSMDGFLQESFGHSSNFPELAQKYRRSSDQVGLVHAMLLYTVRAVLLLETANREPLLLHPGEDGRPETHLVGISAGLWNAVSVPISTNFNILYDASIEAGRVWVRVCSLMFGRARSREDRPGVWGWAILGISLDELEKKLEQFQHDVGVPSSKRAKVGFTGDRWNTIIGPPSVLELIFTQCPELKKLPNHKIVGIRGLQHTLDVSESDMDYVVGNSTLLETPLRPGFKVWGMTDDDASTTYANWGHLLRVAALQTLSQRLDLVKIVGKLNTYLGTSSENVDVKMMGPSGHVAYINGILKATRQVSIEDDLQSSSASSGGEGLREGAVAIVGMSGKGPGSEDMDEFWNVIVTGQDCHQEIPAERMDLDEYYCTKHSSGKCTMTCRHGCFIKNPGHFDAKFFHISPREALLMEPVHRHFLMSAYEALETAGYSAGQTKTTDPNKTAVFFAQSFDDWLKVSHHALGCDAYTLQSIQRAFGPGRLAFQMKWEGPTYALDSACAGSTSAIHLACMSLLSRDVDMAVAGATTILSDPHSFTFLSKAGVLSETGGCKTYRDDADGYCRADFSGALVLKRLEDAVAHNDNILAVIASSAINHSGNATSITTSDANAQESLFKKVLRNARLDPDDVSYIEMHGTGTQVGDKAEMGAVSKVFLPRPSGKPLPVGAIKANIGHSEAAAGMSSILKSILMLQKGIIPPQAGMPHAMNPNVLEILGDDPSVVIPTKPTEFTSADGKPKRILINNFDAAGGNASVLIEEYKKDQASLAKRQEVDVRSSHVIAVSARTPTSHLANIRRLAEWLRANPNARIQDVAYSTTARKVHHPFRFALAAPTLQDAVSKLEAEIQRANNSAKKSSAPRVVFAFTGQGSHYAGMGSELYHTSPVFRKTADLCAAICASHQFPAFLDIITNNTVDLSTKNAAQVQLAVVALEIALTAFWRSSAGIEPSMVMGHSLGEYAALHAAGVLSLSDTLYLVGQRALLLLERCELNSCAMLSVSAPVATVREHLARLGDSSCGVACINGPTATVISGTAEDLARIQTSMTTKDANLRTKMLPVPFAFHSFQMDAILPDYKALASGVTYLPPKIPVASTLLASVVDVPGVFGEDYLARQTRQAVDFSGGLNVVKSALKNDDPLWLEIGPGPVCTSFVRSTLSPPPARINHTIDANNSNWSTISKTLVAAYTSGIDVDWLALHAPYESNLELLTLPTYAWDVKNYWITHTDKNSGTMVPAAAAAKATAPEPFLTTTAQYLVDKAVTPDGQVKVTFRAGISDHGFMGVIDGHRMQQIGLASGTVFCDAAATVAKYALEYSGGKTGVTASNLTFHEPKLLAPLTRDLVGIDGDLVTTATMDSASSDVILATFKAISKSGETYDLGSVVVKYRTPDRAQADLDRVSFFIKAKMEERIRLSKDGSGHRMQPDVFFALFANAVEFSPDFRGVQEAYVASDYQEAAATIKIRPDPVGTRFTASPYWGEALLHLAGFMVNGNPNTPQPLTYALMGYDSIEQLAPVKADKEYLTYTRISRWEGTTAFCSAYVFDPETSKVVMLAIDLRYQQFKRTTWRHILGTRPHAVGAGSQHAAPKSVSLPPVKEKKMTHENLSAAMATVPMKQERASKAQEKAKEQDTADSRAFQVILESLIAATGSDPAEFTDDAEIADIGVDSIMAIEVVAAVTEKGVDLPASFVFDYHTIGDLRRAFGGGDSQDDSDANDTSATPSSGDEDGLLSMTPAAPFTPFTPTSPASSLYNVEKEDPSILAPEPDTDMSPLPSVRITLLQGRPEAGSTPLYMMTDGTGTVASFIHLRHFKSNQAVYGIDSPFLRCPSRMNSKVGIEGVAKLVVDALVKAQSTGPLMIGGYSVGCFVAFEMSRQLAQAGRTVKGLLLIDMPCPRPRGIDQGKLLAEADASEAVLEGIVNRDGQWSALGSRREHMRQFFVAMNEYSPAPMTAAERPAKTAVIWAERGLINRVSDDPAQIQKLEAEGVPTKSYAGFMEDPKLGTFACHVPNKGQDNLGPNGWDKYTGGEVMALSVNGDHFELPMPGHVHLLQEKMENALAYFSSN